MLMPSIFRENFFDSFVNDVVRPANRNLVYNHPAAGLMKTDIKESDESYQLSIELPGYKKEDVKAQLKDGYMTITASINTGSDEKDESGNYIRRERYSGNSSRTFYVGDTVTEEDITAKFEDGILNITVPKKQPEPKVEEEKFITIEG